MLAFVKGKLDTVTEDYIIVENQGNGYEILVPGSVIQAMPQVGNEVKIYTYLYVREDVLQLYGFLTKDQLDMFKLLITVNGIGPKGALGILTVMDVDALRLAILSDDAKSIAKSPGIGAKTAGKLNVIWKIYWIPAATGHLRSQKRQTAVRATMRYRHWWRWGIRLPRLPPPCEK